MTRRTQADRSAATRSALVAAGRRLFAEHGFAAVGTEAIVAEAAVSRGALYHHFADKTELFAGVLEAVEAGITDTIATAALTGDDLTFGAVMTRAFDAWLDACEQPDVQRILLTDGPSVLGWTRWRAILQPYVMTLIESSLLQGIADGSVVDLPARPLAHALIAVGEEAALYIASADDREVARQEMSVVIERLLTALVAP
ncbi:TetR/AcrR family transcriptional regulator [Nocardioides humilatus]|uniref:TetR/AcrR family transcriptional regulator n=1 Tax=Nocardioides humilatus TaxID=2607660 RepID=A0A5B1LNJ3_9ACTN|nr:TetR/AcrR family transcriptional regulator [Nocardioides humilatus]KAA1421177.1 TetR/AcrR family transcriptional regulator [Nocardioides humilatus]